MTADGGMFGEDHESRFALFSPSEPPSQEKQGGTEPDQFSVLTSDIGPDGRFGSHERQCLP